MRIGLLGLVLSAMVANAWGQTCQTPSTVDVLTHRNNKFRTGANLHETCLTWDNVNTIRKLFTLPVEGQVYAQPLVKTNFQILNKATKRMETHNVVFIATMKNWLYAFDADEPKHEGDIPKPYWAIPPHCAGKCEMLGLPLHVNRIPWDEGASKAGQFNIYEWVGITSTPVIDPETNTMFLVAKVADPAPSPKCDWMPSTPECPVENWIYAINLVDGTIVHRLPIDLGTPEAMQVDRPKACKPYHVHDPRKDMTTQMGDANRIHMQRAALLMTGSAPQLHIYLGFGSHQDAPCPMYHGMMVRFDFDTQHRKLTQFKNTFMVTKKGEIDLPFLYFFHHEDQLGKGGIWQAGNGPAADPQGNVYVMTGNGTFKAGEEFGGNILKLSPDLDPKPIGYFASRDVKLLDTDVLDVDLGASGPVLVPGTGQAQRGSRAPSAGQLFGGGKQGKLYLVSTQSVGGKLPSIQGFWAARGWSVSITRLIIHRWDFWFPVSIFPQLFATGYHHIHGAPAYWGDPDEVDPQDTLERSLYVWPERDHLRSFGYRKDPGKDGKFIPKPLAEGPKASIGMPGGSLSISANGIENGILWAALPVNDDAWVRIVQGQLRAFKINADGSKIEAAWTSYCSDPKDDFKFAKYVPPTVANGRVYLATFSEGVNVYGVPSSGAKPSDPNCKAPPRK
jgi:hypothetical protein